MKYGRIDGVVVLRPIRHKTVISEMFPPANLVAWYGKPNLTHDKRKERIRQSKAMYYNTK